MIVGIGIDLISNHRIKKIIQKFNNQFKNKIFSAHELHDFEKRFGNKQALDAPEIINFFAKRFCAKEAFSKALGTGIGRGINFNDIEVYNDQMGKPLIRIINDKATLIKQIIGCENFNIHLTITDEKSISGAVVIIEKTI